MASMPRPAAVAPWAAPGLELKVEAVWHEQIHKSRVATLSFSADGCHLWSGCDAAAPKPVVGSGQEAPIAAINCQDGSISQRLAGVPACNVRLLQPLCDGSRLRCVTGDGGVLEVGPWPAAVAANADVDACAAPINITTLPGMPAATVLPAAEPEEADASSSQPHQQQKQQGGVATGQQEGQAEAAEAEAEGAVCSKQEVQGQAAGGASTLPEFVAEAGYRGHREGYLFREGSLGSGYYRKDVVRQYCASAAATSAGPDTPPQTAPCAAGVGSDSSSSITSGGSILPPAAAAVTGGGGQQQPAAEAARQYIQRLLKAPPSMHSVISSPSGDLLFTSSLGSADHSIRVWRLHPSSRRSSSTLDRSSSSSGGGSSSGSSCAASPGSCGLQQPELFRTLTGHSASVLSLALSPDGRLLFSGSHDHTIRVWSIADWHCLRVLKGHGGGVRGLVVAPDASVLYSAASDNTIRAWSMRYWVCLRTLHGRHEDTTWPACLALSPDGSLLASGSTGPFGASTLKVFQTTSGGSREAGACLATFAQLGYNQKAGMSALLFSPDGHLLYSGASDGTVAAWRLRWQPSTSPSARGLRKGFL